MKVAIANLKAADFDKTLLNSVINTGFVVLTHHDINYGLIKECQDEWRKFFKREQKYKDLFVNGNDSNMGYKGMGTETAVGAKTADLKEFFHWKLGADIPLNLDGMMAELFYDLENIALDILGVIDQVGDTSHRSDCQGSTKTLFRTLYYPALDKTNIKEGAVRAAAHEDINHITMLVAASAPGLEVMDLNGKWHAVPHEENSITCNIGDMLQLASKGLYKSTTHRVVNPKDETSDRISMPLFVHPHGNVELAPGYTAGQFLNERIEKIYGKK